MGCSTCGTEKIEARGLCQKHYMQWWETRRGRRSATTWPFADPPVVRTPRGKFEKCTVVEDGAKCEEPHRAKGMCMRHYQQAWRAQAR